MGVVAVENQDVAYAGSCSRCPGGVRWLPVGSQDSAPRPERLQTAREPSHLIAVLAEVGDRLRENRAGAFKRKAVYCWRFSTEAPVRH